MLSYSPSPYHPGQCSSTGYMNLGLQLDLRGPLKTESQIKCVLYFLGEHVQNHVQKGAYKLKTVKTPI